MRVAVRRLWWGIEGHTVELSLSFDGRLLRGTSRQRYFFLQLLDAVGSRRRVDTKLGMQPV